MISKTCSAKGIKHQTEHLQSCCRQSSAAPAKPIEHGPFRHPGIFKSNRDETQLKDTEGTDPSCHVCIHAHSESHTERMYINNNSY